MKSSSCSNVRRARPESAGLHVAIIMDGNGRWATAQGLPRVAGHRRGAAAVRAVVERAPALGIGTLTLFAFSADNWKRPRAEVQALLAIFRQFLAAHGRALAERDIRLSVIGRRDRVPATLRRAMERAEALTARGRTLRLRLAIDYSGRDAILDAARRLGPATAPTREAFARRLAERGPGDSAPDVDLMIRTGGEQRLSDFLLWESAYAELLFVARPWPDFRARHLAAAVARFRTRQRRFGGLPAAVSA